MKTKFFLVLLFNTICVIPTALSHYLWVTVDKNLGDHGTANVYFEEAPAVGDGYYLDPFMKGGKTWIRTVKAIKPQPLMIKEKKGTKKHWLSAALTHSPPRSIDSYGKFGVYRYGETDVLLHYYARYLDVETHEDLHELARAEHLHLDIVPHDVGNLMELTVLWKGKAATNRVVHIRGPNGLRENPTTDDAGKVHFTIKGAGTYRFRTSVEEDQAGQDGEDHYSLIRHNATMMILLPLKK